MRSLKILVVALGVVLVAGIVGLGFAVSYRLNHPRPVAPVTTATAATGASIVVDLPPGAKVLKTKAGGDRLVVRVGLADGGEELLIFNLETGAQVATIELKPGELKPGEIKSAP